MNNIWENSSTPWNCRQCVGDQPYFIPFTDYDFFALRLQLPFALVESEGGGIPVHANFDLDIVDEEGSTNIFSFGDADSNKFNLGYRINNTDKLAEYQIYAPIPFADANNVVHLHKYITVAAGDLVQISGGGYSELFYVSQDSIPYPLYMISATRLGIPVDAATVGTLAVSVNGTPATPEKVYPTEVGVASEIACFRFKITITYVISGNVYEYYTKPFKRIICNEDTLRLEGQYPAKTIDCEMHMHQNFTWNYNMFSDYKLFARIDADIFEISPTVRKTFNGKCFAYKSEKQRRFALKSNPLPRWQSDDVENIMMSKVVQINNIQYYNDQSETISKDSDVDTVLNPNIDVILTTCKCENVFSC